MKKIKRKVVCVFGKFDEKSDFVLEPVCSDDCKCEICKDGFWIEGDGRMSKKDILKCKHKWEHIVELSETLAGTDTLALFHKCKKCGLESSGIIMNYQEKKNKLGEGE